MHGPGRPLAAIYAAHSAEAPIFKHQAPHRFGIWVLSFGISVPCTAVFRLSSEHTTSTANALRSRFTFRQSKLCARRPSQCADRYIIKQDFLFGKLVVLRGFD